MHGIILIESSSVGEQSCNGGNACRYDEDLGKSRQIVISTPSLFWHTDVPLTILQPILSPKVTVMIQQLF